MDFRIFTLTIILLLLNPSDEGTVRKNRNKRSLHVPPLGAPSFRRDSVEQVPLWQTPADRSAAYTDHAEFGSRSLPLRSAVESIPDVNEATRRLPLRDAVEKRPPPDEAYDLEYDIPETYDQEKNTIPLPIYRGSGPSNGFIPQIPFSIPHKYSVLQTYLTPQGFLGSQSFPQPQTYYSPLQHFRNVLGNLGNAPPYRADNGNQQLLVPFYLRAKSLFSDNPFLKGFRPHEEYLERIQVQSVDNTKEAEKRIVCYVEGNAVYRKEPLTFSPEDLDPFACTHVIYAFASIDPHSYQIIARDEEYDIIQGAYRSVTGLKRKNPYLKVLISVGGGREEGAHRFSNLIANSVRRRDFIRSAVSFIRQYNFDGLDLHWQYPGAEELGGHSTDKEYFALFLEELSEVFKPHGWLLTVSAPASRFRIEDGFNPLRLANTVDFVNMQAYDFHRDREPVADHHAPLSFRPHDNDLDIFYNVEYAVRYWLKKGLPRSKLVVGIPFFGRSFTLQYSNDTEVGARIKGPGKEGYYTQNPGFLAYFEICDMIINEGLTRRTDTGGAPYVVNGDQWIGYDDPESIERKLLYVKDMNLGGVFVWSADLDDFKGLCGEKWPLMSALKRYLKGNDVPNAHPQLPTKPVGTCESDGLYSDPRNCANYYICRSGLSYHLSCGSHMMFDPNTGRCDYVEANLCRPGQTIHIPNALKDIDNILRREKLVSADKSPKVVCYVTNWAFYRKGEGKFVPEHLDQRLCTHVVYAFASLDPEKLLVKEFDPWADLDNNLYERITSLRDTKVLLALGGWTDSAGDKYSRLVSDGSARRKFVVGAVSFLRRHGFQGLHIDWNYPICWQSNCQKGPASDKPNFSKLVQELRREFDRESPPLTLAVAISGYKEVIDAAYELPALGQATDFMSVMSYDYHGSWERRTGHVSPLYHRPGDMYPQYNTNFTMEYLVSNGAPREKLLVGVPFYGQTFTLAHSGKYDQGVPSSGTGEAGEYTRQPGMLSYYEVCSRIRNHRWIVNRDNQRATGPYAYYGDQWVGYEDVESVTDKARYIKNRGFGGAIAWTVDLDDFLNKCCQGSFPLLQSLNKGLGLLPDTGSSQGDCTKPPEPVTPPAPTMTTGFDTGAQSSSSTTPHWGHPTRPSSKPTTASTAWWETTPSSTTSSSWWEPSRPISTSTKKPSSTPWWVPSTPKPTTEEPTVTTTKKPSTTTPPWWQPEVTTIPPPAVIMPEVEHEPPTKCETGQYLPDPYNCNAYYRCILGEMKKQYCAGGLHWNIQTNNCDWPGAAKCKEEKHGSKPPSSHLSTTSTKFTTQGWSTHRTRPSSEFTTRTTTERISTTRPPPTDALEHCTTGDYYPHENCNSFYVCVNDKLVTQSCAPGLHWNAESGICDWSYKVKCLNRKELASHTQKLVKNDGDKPHQPNAPCQAGSFSAYAGDCTQYLLCLWNKYETFQCSEGLHWNSDKKICDWPEHAHCTEGGGPAVGNDEEGPIEQTTPGINHKPTKPPYEWSSTARPTPPTTTAEVPSGPFEPLSGYYKIVCYFTNWAWYRKGVGKYVPEDIDPNLCTHIVYGFAVLDYENLIVKAHDSWADFDNNFYERVVAYKKKGLKVSLALGGWNDSQGDKYSRLVNNPAARARFIKHVIGFLEKYDFDGLDLDWEYPKCWQVDCNKGPDSDKPAFAAFVAEIAEAFRPKGYLLSSAVSPSKTVIDAGYDVPVLAKHFDWIAVMTYDFHGQWDKQTGHVAPMYLHPEDEVAYFNSNFTINYWISEGVPRRKIIMGMPLYGQSFQLENAANHGLNAKAPGPGQAGEFTRAAGFLAYYEICDRVKNRGWNVVQDPKRRLGPYAYKGNQWVSYDDKEMIRLKSEYVRQMDLGGGMIWALDLDDFKNRCGEGRHPLLSEIRRVLAAPGTGVPEVPTAAPEHKKPKPPKYTLPPSVDATSVSVPMPHSTSAPSIVSRDSQYKVVCYFTNWAWYRQGVGKYLPSDIDPDLCTHIVYGFAVLNGDQMVIKPHDTWADFDNKFYEKITAFKEKGIKVLIAIGGWNDSAGDKYSKLVNNPSARRLFIAHVMDFIEKNNFDGLDLDWEYPTCWQVDCNKGPESDKPAFADFVRELHDAFRPKGWLLSAAVSPSRKVVDAGYDVPALSRYLDWIAVMCYDYHGQWDKITGHVAPMYAHPEDEDVTFNTNFTIHYWINQGADRKKLVLGMPMYGQSFSLANNDENGLNAPTYGGGEAGEETRARGFLAYYEICSNIIQKGWNVVRDKKGRIGPYAYLRDQWVSFDDIAMIQHKSEYIKEMGLGGGMIWALDLDDFKNLCGCEDYPLLRTINRVLRDYAKPAPKCELGTERPHVPSKPKPTTQKPWQTERPPWQTEKPQAPWETEKPQAPWETEKPQEPWQTQKPPYQPPSASLPCSGQLFVAHDNNCNQYYLCNQGQLILQACPTGLFWNRDHCDWPENTECHPDASTLSPPTTAESHRPPPPHIPETPVIQTTPRPSRPGTTVQPGAEGYKVVCYFTNWAWYRQGIGKYVPDDIDPSLCTHITYGFAVLDSNSLTIKPHDSWADIDNDFYKKVTSYQSYGIKVLIALGGWNDSLGNKYSRLVNDPQARARFVTHVAQFIEKWGFDGLDLDWEYPKCWQVDCNKGPHSDKQGFAALVAELSAEFRPKGWLLSSAVSPSKSVIDAGYDVPSISQHFDWIAVMTYDFHGHWDKQTGHVAPLYYYPGDTYDYFNANFSLNYWIEMGAPPSKLVMGMPLYGQSFSLADTSNKGLNERAYGPGEAGEFTRAGGFLAFYEICERVKRRSWAVTRDPQGRIGPYAVMGNQWVSYDDIAEIKRKSRLVKELGLGGGMIWALDLDDFRNTCGCGKHPLLKTMNNELRGVPIDINLENCT